MERNKRHPQRGHLGFCYDLFRNYCRRTVSTRDCRSHSGSRREHRYRRGYPAAIYHYLAIGLLSVTPAFAAPEDPTVQNSSNPVAAATGNVTNQAVQFQNNGAPSRQYFANNVSCNGATMQLSPFYMGNDTIPYEDSGYVRSNNFGMQLNFSVPLDGSMIELCKSIARKHEQKLRLDYELVRALKCTEIMKAGFMFRPGSRVEVLCHDVIPIVANDKEKSDRGSVQ